MSADHGKAEGAVDLAVLLLPRERLTPTIAAAERLVDELASLPRARAIVVAHPKALPSARVQARAEVVVCEDFLLPWQARALACSRLRNERYVAFVDNDVELEPGALQALVLALDETGAGAAHPLVLHRQAGKHMIHIARGILQGSRSQAGDPVEVRFNPVMEHLSKPVSHPVGQRTLDDYTEMHTLVLTRRALEAVLPLSPVAIAEEIELSFRLRHAGERIVFEPAAVCTYVADPAAPGFDRDYFSFRWAAGPIEESMAVLEARWPLVAQYWEAKRAWLPRHRRLAADWYRVAHQVGRAVRAVVP